MITSKYMDMASDGHMSTISCRLCKARIYESPVSPSIDHEKMEDALEHLEIKHQVNIIEIWNDFESLFQFGKGSESGK